MTRPNARTKQMMRSIMREKCREIDSCARAQFSHALVKHLLVYIDLNLDSLRKRGVFGFRSMDDEVDLSPLENELIARQISFQALTLESQGSGDPPALVLVPGLAFDRSGARLGRGKGYFDRLLADLRAQSEQIVAIGVGYEHQLVDEVPKEGHDQAVDFLCLPVRGLVPCSRFYQLKNNSPS